jgi:decaprenylphospho-beta-D-ribofuranose 2-oxidase
MAISKAQDLANWAEHQRHRRLETSRIGRLTGFGMTRSADGYIYRPSTVEEARGVFELARGLNRKVVLRGAGRSYGDANIGAECIVLDNCRMNRIVSWDPETGVIDAECGATIEDLWRHVLEDGWWPPVVSGTMYPTLGGALAMNIHGKNNFSAGTLGEHVVELEILTPAGDVIVLHPEDDAFYAIISSAGLLAMIMRVKLQMKKVHSGDLRVLPLSVSNWNEQFAAFEQFEQDADYMVSWIDCFGSESSSGRGLFHAAWYTEEPGEHPHTLDENHQDLPDTILNFWPKSMVWRILKKFNNRLGMEFVNWAKFASSRKLGNGRPHPQSLVGFSFLLDYVPNWRNAYLPLGFIQYQCFVPKEYAKRVFELLIKMQQQSSLESYLAVMKRHRRDKFLFSHAVDGYSLALDFKVTHKNWQKLWSLCHQMNDLVLKAGGRFYFAKDSTLRPEDVKAYLGEERLTKFVAYKKHFDPESILTSDLARRLKLA